MPTDPKCAAEPVIKGVIRADAALRSSGMHPLPLPDPLTLLGVFENVGRGEAR